MLLLTITFKMRNRGTERLGDLPMVRARAPAEVASLPPALRGAPEFGRSSQSPVHPALRAKVTG